MLDRTPNDTATRRFWKKVNKRGPVSEYRPDLGPCWLWTGAPSTYGYGRFRMGGAGSALVIAHNAAWELLVGPVPSGTHVDHLCRVRLCVNPGHLEPVTVSENIHRSPVALAPANTAKTHCPQGHPYDDVNTYVWGGKRNCKACRYPVARERSRRWREARSKTQ